jgi:7-carboxy-7-deazaguanine synthase
MFVRIAGCDYRCVWCDSKFTWDGTEKATQMSATEIFEVLNDMAKGNFQYVTISGGNPALIGQGVKELINLLHQNNIKVSVETQGSKWQDWFRDVDCLTISPKPPSSQMITDYTALRYIVENCSKENLNLKVVVFNDKDYVYAKQIHQLFPDVPFYLQVGNERLDKQGDISNELLNKLKWLMEKVIYDKEMNSVKVLPQLHSLIWGNERAK